MPVWMYGPNGQSNIFETEAHAPPDWTDSPGGEASPREPVDEEAHRVARPDDQLRPLVEARMLEIGGRPDKRWGNERLLREYENAVLDHFTDPDFEGEEAVDEEGGFGGVNGDHT